MSPTFSAEDDVNIKMIDTINNNNENDNKIEENFNWFRL